MSFAAAAALAAVVVSSAGRAAGPPACDPDNGGIKLPQGFCAAVVADNVGRARHLFVAPNGDVFVTTQTGRGGAGGGIVALRDADGDGKFETKEQFGLSWPATPRSSRPIYRSAVSTRTRGWRSTAGAAST